MRLRIYSSLVTLVATTSKGTTTVAATILRGGPHVVRINDYWVDIVPTDGFFLLSDPLDRPGIVGAVGDVAGAANMEYSIDGVSAG